MARYGPTVWRLFLLALVLVVLMPAVRAVADGKVFATGIIQPTIPDQEALIHWADGVQTLVIETRFTRGVPPAVGVSQPNDQADARGGVPSTEPPESHDLAWVVPIPAKNGEEPEVFEVTPGLFPTLRSVFAPRVEVRERWGDVLIAIVVLGGGLAVIGRFPGESCVVRVIAMALFAVIAIVVLLPTLGRARSAGEGSPVDVLSRSRVGSYEVAVLQSENGSACATWLNANGFKLDPDVAPVLEAYGRDGWAFVAAKPAKLEHGGEIGEAIATHPLGFRFKTDKPVYPLRLTAHATDRLGLDLYVFGPGMAECKGLSVTRCDLPSYEDVATLSANARSSSGRWGTGSMQVAHEGLFRLADAAAVGTKLSGELSKSQMSTDLVLEWSEARPIGDKAYTRRGALERAAVPAAFGCMLGLVISARKRRDGKPIGASAKRTAGALAMLGLAIGLTIYASTVTVRTYSRAARGGSLIRHHYRVADELFRRFDKTLATEAEVRAAAAELVRASFPPEVASSIREIDAPWNYQLRMHDTLPMTLEYVWFDAVGRPVRSQPYIELTAPVIDGPGSDPMPDRGGSDQRPNPA